MLLEILIPVITFVIGFGWKSIQRYFRFKTFRKVFGTTIMENLFIMIPDYQLIKGKSLEDHRVVKYGKDGIERETFYGTDDIYGQKDVEAAMEIGTLFGNFFKKPIQLINDKMEPSDHHTSGVVIGSHIVNWYLRDLMKDTETILVPGRFVKDAPQKNQLDNVYYNKHTGEFYKFDQGKTEYSALIRTKNPYKENLGYIFLIFGIHASGTLAAAKFLRENWFKFTHEPDVSGVLLKMPTNRIRQCKVEKWLRNGQPANGKNYHIESDSPIQEELN
jgi:hypothetical protein